MDMQVEHRIYTSSIAYKKCNSSTNYSECSTNSSQCFHNKYSDLVSDNHRNHANRVNQPYVRDIDTLSNEEAYQEETNNDCINFIEEKSSKRSKIVQFLVVQLFCLLHYFDILDALRKYQIEPSKSNILRMIVSFGLGTGKLLSFIFSYLLTASSFVSILSIGGLGWPVLLIIGLGVAAAFLGIKVVLTKTTNSIHKKYAQIDLWLQQHQKTKYIIFAITFTPIVILYTVSKLMGNPTFIGFYTADKEKVINPSICLISRDLEIFFKTIHNTVQVIRVAYSVISSVGFGFAILSWTGVIDGASIVSAISSYIPQWLAGFLTKIPTLPESVINSTHGIIGLAVISINLIWNWLKFLNMEHMIDVNSKKIISQDQINYLYIKETNDEIVIKILKEQLEYRRAILLYIIEEFTHRLKTDSQLLVNLRKINFEQISRLKISSPETISIWLFKSLRNYPFAESCQCIQMQVKDVIEHEINIKLLLKNLISEINSNQSLLEKRLARIAI